MLVIARHHEVLRQLGLDGMDGVKRFKGELIKNHKGRRDIQRIEQRIAGTAPAADGKLVLYLKRHWKPYRKDGLKSLFARGAVWSQSRLEWENSLALQRAGIAVAEPIAFGDECGPLWEKFSFILTAAARGTETVEHFLRPNKDAAERRRVFDGLARMIRKMHDAGLASPDLFTRHIFVKHSGELEFCLIDMARLDRRRMIPAAMRARDLAALHVTAPLRFVTKRERMRFLREYGGDGALLELIEQRAAHLLQRRKFADFARPE